MRVYKKFYSIFICRGYHQISKIRGSKNARMAVYNLDYRPLSKIGGWLSTKIRKSKIQKIAYHLHHPTISRFHQPHLNPIPPHTQPHLTTFFDNPPLSNHPPHTPNTSPHHNPTPLYHLPKINKPPTPKIPPLPPWVSPKSTFNLL